VGEVICRSGRVIEARHRVGGLCRASKARHDLRDYYRSLCERSSSVSRFGISPERATARF
jgi:hypothetical protein